MKSKILRIAMAVADGIAVEQPQDSDFTIDVNNLVNTVHYTDEAHVRRQQAIDTMGGIGNPICWVYLDKGHYNGPEVHILTDNAIIIVVNYRTKRLVTTKFARPGQIRQLFGHLDLMNGRVFDAKHVPDYVFQRAIKYSRDGMNNL